MSGLVSFFHDFIELKEGTSSYDESTSRLTPQKKQCRFCFEKYPTDDEVNHEHWADQHKSWLNAFMHERLMDDEVNDDEALPRIPHHIRDTLHKATRFDDLDLKTNKIDLGTLQVERIWANRHTRRGAVERVIPRQQVMYSSEPELFSMSLEPCQADGPLGNIFNFVVSMSVTQHQPSQALRPNESSRGQEKAQLQQLAVAAMSELGPPPAKRLNIFLYDQYAKAFTTIISHWNRRKNNNTQTLRLKLLHVPAMSVLPDSGHVLDWFKLYDAANYCLCLGDRSRMRIREDKKAKACFDGTFHEGADVEDLLLIQVQLVTKNDDQVIREWEISSRYEKYVKEIKRVRSAPKDAARQSLGSKSGGQKRPAADHGRDSSNAPPRSKQRTQDAQFGLSAQFGVGSEGQTQGAIAVPQNQNQQDPTTPSNLTARLEATKTQTKDFAQGTRLETRNSIFADTLGLQAAARDDVLHYDRLSDLPGLLIDNSSRQVNLYAVVIGMSTPSRTSTGDWMVSLALVDDSLQTTIAGEGQTPTEAVPDVILNAFAKDKVRLPGVKRSGDVIRIHRAQVKTWQGNVQLTGNRPTSYLVYHGNDESGSDFACVVSSPSKNCSVRESDENQFPRLWSWGQERIQAYPTMKSDHTWTLAECQDKSPTGDEAGDLTVMVTAIVNLPNSEAPHEISYQGFLRVWDGTGVPPYDEYPIAVDQQVRNEGDPPPAAISKLCSLVSRIKAKKQCNLQVPEAVAGHVANVTIWEKDDWEFIQLYLEPGSFVRLRNVHVDRMPRKGDVCLQFHSKSHLTPLPDMTYEVVQLIEDHNRRLLRGESVNPESGVLPLSRTDHETDEIDTSKTTASVSEFTSFSGPALFCGLVRISDTIPSLKTSAENYIYDTCRQQGAIGLSLRGDGGSSMEVLVEWGSTKVVVVEKLLGERTDGSRGQDMTRLLRAIKDRELFEATVISTVFEGSRYFVLDTMESFRVDDSIA